MTELTGKQKRFLRALGQKLRPTCAIGKAGQSQAVIDQISGQLARHELVKVRLPGGSAADRRHAVDELAAALAAHPVALLGRNALLYRPYEHPGTAERIQLP